MNRTVARALGLRLYGDWLATVARETAAASREPAVTEVGRSPPILDSRARLPLPDFLKVARPNHLEMRMKCRQ
jgi:hypothetical protein